MPVRLILSAVCCISLTNCVTGIESTPRITEKEVRRNVPSVNPESEIAAQLTPDPMNSWRPRRQFLVTDPKISLLFEKEPDIAAGEILIFDNLGTATSVTGDTISVLTFHRMTDAERAPLLYKLSLPPASLAKASTLPMSVDLAMVDAARNLLVGKRFYIITAQRIDSGMTPGVRGRKYIPVTITDISPGNADYPLRVNFTDDRGVPATVAMTVGTSKNATRNFDRIFTLSDPRLLHPAITDDVWQHIVNSRVVAGMTPAECRLAIGNPLDIRKWHNGGSFFESWACEDGRYILFIDGLLSEIR